MKKSKINRFVVFSLQLAVILLLVGGSASIHADQMPEELVGANNDDGDENNVASCDPLGVYIGMRYIAGNDRFGFCRFTSIPIAQGATIDACTLFVYIITANADDPDIDIFGEDTASATTLEFEDNCISSRIQTTAHVEWIATSIGTGYKPSPELKTIVQEVINREDWSYESNLAFICVVNSNSNFVADSYESSGDMAKLHIWYTTGEPPEAGQVIIIH